METKITRQLRCVLTERELLDIGKQMAERAQEIVALDDDKSRVSKDFAARIAEKEASQSILSNKIMSGYEFRAVTCSVHRHIPKTGMKTIIRDDTIESVSIEQMTPNEMQEELPLDSQQEDPPRVQAVPLENTDYQVDETLLEVLLKAHLKSVALEKALEQANLATLRRAQVMWDGGGLRGRKIMKQMVAVCAAAKS
jgi:hypothetical protein